MIFVSIDKKKKESQEEEDEEVIVSVKDTGGGYQRKSSKLFTKFATSDPTTGTGLGYIFVRIL